MNILTGFFSVPEVQIMTVVIVGFFVWKGLTASKDNKDE